MNSINVFQKLPISQFYFNHCLPHPVKAITGILYDCMQKTPTKNNAAYAKTRCFDCFNVCWYFLNNINCTACAIKFQTKSDENQTSD